MTPVDVRDEPRWFGEPRGLTILFFTQMWEQFSYYGMRALLIYYMTKQLLLDQAHASYIYGFYTAFAYFTPIFGGVVADRWLGRRRAVIIGGTTMALGHFMMTQEPLFYVALATIALGNGLFLPSLPSQIGDLYQRGDPRRSWAYNVYYVGINLGGLLAPLVCGTLGEVYGWHYGLGAAGIGMTIGLVIYIVGQPYLPPERLAVPVVPAETPRRRSGAPVAVLLVAIWLATTLFRGSYEQVGNTIALWADVAADRDIGGFTIPMTWFQAINPLVVVLFTPFLLRYWQHRAAEGKEPAPVRKMALGALIVAASYALLAGVEFASGGDRASWLWLVLFFVVFTVGELYILPTGLGIFARLAPANLGATTVAGWFFAIFTGSLFAGYVGSFWSDMPRAYFLAAIATLSALSAIFYLIINVWWRRASAEADEA
jgi:proton-dependent oligopeptide transporter, POT family